jgi:hypothetical protein
VDTTGYGGKRLEKSAEVLTNDPKEPVVHLVVAGPVDRFVSITPRMLNLRGAAGERLQGTITVVPEEKYPFRLTGVQPREGRLKASFGETRQDGRPAYAVQVENALTEAGSYSDTLVLKTDSSVQPQLEVRVYVTLRPTDSPVKKAN